MTGQTAYRPSQPIPSAIWSAQLSFLKGEFWSLTGWEIGPDLLLVLIEAAKKGHVAIEGAELGQCNRTVWHIDDAGIELAHHVEHTHSRLIEIPTARIPRIRKQVNLDRAASRPCLCEMKIVPREEWIRGSSRDGQSGMIS